MAKKNQKEKAPARGTHPKNQGKHTKKKSQEQVVLAELRRCKRKGVTSWDLITKHHITRASGRIWDLRHRGYKIDTILETKNGATYARYYLREEA